MDADCFDAVTRVLVTPCTRRGVFGTLAATLGLGSLLTQETAAETKQHTIERNEFRCVAVGGKCGGNGKHCCSGLCRGKKPKKGQRDKSTCVAHDESTCQPRQTVDVCGGATVRCETSEGLAGECITTTGNAGYCFFDGDCWPCKKDADCISLCGPRAACVPCQDCAEHGLSTACVGTGVCLGIVR